MGCALLALVGSIAGLEPFQMFLIALPVGVVALFVLMIRALVRVGDKNPKPITIVAPTPTPPVSGPAPGWYPHTSGVVRWFDGQHWTDIVQPPQ